MGPYGQAQDKKKEEEGRSLLRRAVVVTSHGTSSRTILFCSKRVSFKKTTLASWPNLIVLTYITFMLLF